MFSLAEIAKDPTKHLGPSTQKVERIIVHWTAGSYVVSALDKMHYHFVIDRDGIVHPGHHRVAANMRPITRDYAAHTYMLNTGSIGIAVACMAGATQSNPGRYPMTRAQWNTMIELTAIAAKHFNLPVSSATVLGHHEVASVYGIDQGGKWDPGMLPWSSGTPRSAVARAFRDAVRTKMSTGASSVSPETTQRVDVRVYVGYDSSVAPLVIPGVLTNGTTAIPVRALDALPGWAVGWDESTKAPYLLVSHPSGTPSRKYFSVFDLDSNGTAYVELRHLQEVVQAHPPAVSSLSLRWESATKTVIVRIVPIPEQGAQ